ncbi:MAG: bifunctional 23S rRNA (guanine(2069)-N(7))-methyltransferase RlmK/23S rRNA (guanine(2445)-N(2))-methyltransferase RlmL [Deltaproteobacteria bacterium]|nr:bifunctional 23S rRNA (guanine(2069)-N(7))-methyltransferase RlmK/23S rRNA (guanine(2445)-N(2))-methyltransferase RlmL [Deltaproteobacteria bacterium]
METTPANQPEARLNLFATAAKGLEKPLAEELRRLGAGSAQVETGGVGFRGTIETAYRACLWSRLASRILLPLATFPAANPEQLYEGIRTIDWERHLDPDGTFAVDCAIFRSRIKHSHYAALKAKDAIADQFRDRRGRRPSVATERPDLRINLHLKCNRLTVSLDLSGDSLHRRGYRDQPVLAPLKENLAAALLILSGWPQIAAEGGWLVDPMCGSGTIPIEAALIATDSAPGLLRSYFGFLGWKGHDAGLWERLLLEAQGRRRMPEKEKERILACDCDGAAMETARRNARAAGMENAIRFQHRAIRELQHPWPTGDGEGLVVVNPPYGERLSRGDDLKELYRQLGQQLRRVFPGWKAGLLTGSAALARELSLPLESTVELYNGPIACALYGYRIPLQPAAPETPAAPSEMLANRLLKNLRRLKRWAEREQIDCFRLYDADIPEYAAAIDLYQDWVHVQEYDPPAHIDPEKARFRMEEMTATLAQVLGCPPERIFVKKRQRQKRGEQYRKLDERQQFIEVEEGGLRFLVNLSDYLDTGLFLDHRPTRNLIRELSRGKRFLNLFGYTGAASVYAAAGGAVTTTVDASRTYLDWAQRNFTLNGLNPQRHEFVQEDCRAWLCRQTRRFDLIFVDPPTYSNSKERDDDFFIQRDYLPLLKEACRLLEEDGILLFSTNFRRFKLDSEPFGAFEVTDLSAATIPFDFARNPRIHRCWRFARRAEAPGG